MEISLVQGSPWPGRDRDQDRLDSTGRPLHSGRMPRLVGAVFLAAVLSTSAHADGESAKVLFERATVQFRLGQFHDAALTYQHVYELHPDPVLLYNTAQSYRLANEPEKALLFYKSFLSAKPDAPNHDEVSSRIAELERVVSEQKKANERPPNDVTQPPPPVTQPPAADASPTSATKSAAVPTSERSDGREKRIAGIALLGVAAGALVGGIVTAVLSGQASDSIMAEARAGQPFDPSKESSGQTDTIVSGVMFGLAGAAAVTGGVLMVLGIRDRRAHERKVSLLPSLSTTFAGATATLRY